ncbi:MAG: hypothetical protein KatS3mg119_0900 [Rhodothalassiaceae bacterium]|nr:MAG: hypothetical protein KatS3mg119_0900 [Rhodothalassiaceae bacterium]
MATAGTTGFDESWFWALIEGRLSEPARRAVLAAVRSDPDCLRAWLRVLAHCTVLMRADPGVLDEPVPARLVAPLRAQAVSAS